MKSSTIYLFRHGEIESKYLGKWIGHLDVGLSVRGKQQNEKIAKFIKKLNNCTVITSDLKRTYMGMSKKISKYKELREISFGEWEGLSWKEIAKKYKKESKFYLESPLDFTFPEGESIYNLKERAINKFSELLEHNHSNMAFVIHHGVIRLIISHLFGIPLKMVFNFYIDYGKCATVERVGKHFYLKSLNNGINSK
ncbi:histidine phosphatase family protein [Candidatus Woesearchaeota archaeon]|nr:histidine phosphatase family protein [Candidatus Woesearchaeota archaeon]